MDVLTPEQRHKNMQHIRSKDTSVELKLRKALWHKGIRYRKNYKLLPGKPDIVLTKYHIVVFCDSDYFHGKDWEKLQKHIKRGNNSEYWLKKIEKNIKRDEKVNKELKAMDWIVIRFWSSDINIHLDECVHTVEEAIFERKLSTEESYFW
jgi:DNA mismatch endonuclease (patch repair protein)